MVLGLPGSIVGRGAYILAVFWCPDPTEARRKPIPKTVLCNHTSSRMHTHTNKFKRYFIEPLQVRALRPLFSVVPFLNLFLFAVIALIKNTLLGNSQCHRVYYHICRFILSFSFCYHVFYTRALKPIMLLNIYIYKSNNVFIYVPF